MLQHLSDTNCFMLENICSSLHDIRGSNKLSVNLMQKWANLCVLGLQNTWQIMSVSLSPRAWRIQFLQAYVNLSGIKRGTGFPGRTTCSNCSLFQQRNCVVYLLCDEGLSKTFYPDIRWTAFLSHRLPHTWQNREARTAVFVTSWIVVRVEK
jgi:hypothetical protein